MQERQMVSIFRIHSKTMATQVAVAPMTIFSNTPVLVTNTPISTGSFVFAGSALLFHKPDGFPFTVTYTIDAVAKPITQK